MYIGDILSKHHTTFSFEFFPPKSDEAAELLLQNLRACFQGRIGQRTGRRRGICRMKREDKKQAREERAHHSAACGASLGANITRSETLDDDSLSGGASATRLSSR